MIRKFTFIICFVLVVNYSIYAQNRAFTDVINNISNSINSFLKDSQVATLSVVTLKNTTQLNDNAVQKIYQMIVYRLESNSKIKFKDSMLSFVNGNGNFRLKRNSGVRYLLSVKLIQSKSNIGIGITMYSVILDKTVFTKYLEWKPLPGEIDFLNIKERNFSSYGFDKIVEINAKSGLLDMKTMKSKQGVLLFYFYYYDHIDILVKENNMLKKKNVISLNDSKKYHPVIYREGRLFFFNYNDNEFMIVGNNFSESSIIFMYKQNKWEKYSSINFIPFETFISNETLYFIGGQYVLGKNFFKDRLVLKNVKTTLEGTKEVFYKTIKPFYSISFLKEGNRIKYMYIVDRKYNFINYGPDFQVLSNDKKKSGFVAFVWNNKWIIKTAFTVGEDVISFYKVNELENTPKYKKNIKGEVLFISNGKWSDKKGIWLYIKRKVHNYYVYKLQFWSKKDAL
jgi:hypothetical protein